MTPSQRRTPSSLRSAECAPWPPCQQWRHQQCLGTRSVPPQARELEFRGLQGQGQGQGQGAWGQGQGQEGRKRSTRRASPRMNVRHRAATTQCTCAKKRAPCVSPPCDGFGHMRDAKEIRIWKLAQTKNICEGFRPVTASNCNLQTELQRCMKNQL